MGFTSASNFLDIPTANDLRPASDLHFINQGKLEVPTAV